MQWYQGHEMLVNQAHQVKSQGVYNIIFHQVDAFLAPVGCHMYFRDAEFYYNSKKPVLRWPFK